LKIESGEVKPDMRLSLLPAKEKENEKN